MIKPITNPTLQESKEDENVPRGILLFGQPGTGVFINDVMLRGGRVVIHYVSVLNFRKETKKNTQQLQQ